MGLIAIVYSEETGETEIGPVDTFFTFEAFIEDLEAEGYTVISVTDEDGNEHSV